MATRYTSRMVVRVAEPHASGIIAKVNAVESDVYTPLPAAEQGKVISMGADIDEAYMKRLGNPSARSGAHPGVKIPSRLSLLRFTAWAA